ncbi:CaiB/BaiF CoA-transferase family protein [Nocardioides sp. LS1]|uniref:CaiB/BaiF CoA transferase family protein n=1 Tax=Nocardioides sp. LS1 TaxID=1027620 RepID=UPI000F61AA1E|nr:CaiB/BaiF CoA-transferase family protein [Nocardioides sp. LS1]GCD90151.1 CoA transferase [Nocardioides sp. LS1]
MSDLLRGVRVLELGALLNGSTVGTLLGDLGADVVKIESPFLGDYIRDISGVVSLHNSPPHIQVNKHKRSLTLNLRDERGRELFWRLHETADVFVDGNLAGVADRLGVGYEEQRRRKRGIVYCQYTGYGAQGPYATIPTHGLMMEALAGAQPTVVDADGAARVLVGPAVPPPIQRDMRSGGEATAAGAIHAAFHVAAALVQRDRTGEGAYIDVSAAAAVVANGWIAATFTLNDHLVTDRADLPNPDATGLDWVKYRFYAAADAKVVLFACVEHKFWDRFCELVDRPDLVQRKSSTPAVDFANGDTWLRHQLQEIIVQRDAAYWVDLAAREDLPIGPAPRTISEVADDPQMRQLGIFHKAPDPAGNDWTYIGEPAIVAGQPYRVQRPAPAHGEHTTDLLTGLGVTATELAQLRAAGVI